METPLVQEDGYFAAEYLGFAVGMGMIWLVASQTPLMLVEYWVKPNRWASIVEILLGLQNTTVVGHTLWTQYAFTSMAYGSQAVFGTMFILFLLAFIQKTNFQKAYYMGMTYLTYISWALGAWVLTAFILGATLDDEMGGVDEIGYNIMYGLIYVAVMISLQMGAGYGLGPKTAEYYRWMDQEWWMQEEDMEMDM